MKIIYTLSTAVLVALTPCKSFAGLNGPNPSVTEDVSRLGGGSGLGAAQLGGSFSADGALYVGNGVAKKATIVTNGAYQVDFNRSLIGCTWTASISQGTFTGSPPLGFVSVAGRYGTVRSLFVQTWNQNGTPTNLPFAVHVICG